MQCRDVMFALVVNEVVQSFPGQRRMTEKQNMERELRNAIEASVKNQVMDGIVAAHDSIELPATLVGREVNTMRQQMFQQFGGAAPQDMDLASVLPDEMFADQAKRRVKLGLVVAEMIGHFDLTAEPAKVPPDTRGGQRSEFRASALRCPHH